MKKELIEYNKKRNFSKTKEPIGKIEKGNLKLKYCLQHHIARKDHYDLRLEWDGVLKSWAVPKGPSYDIKTRRLAIQVEDHPLSYINFEGIIPKGEYGGGTVMLFDIGTWEPLEVDFKKGYLKFIIKGKRLKGTWTLVALKENNWLLIKEKEDIKNIKEVTEYKTSIKTNRTMEEITNNINPKNNNLKKELNKIKISSPEKIIIKKPKLTKLDIVNYYKKVSSYMLPYLKNRIISTIRCPKGGVLSCFYKKHLETNSTGIKKIKLFNKSNKNKNYYYITNEIGLIDEVQMNSFEFHVWGSTIKNIDEPNMMVFDLDPDESLNLKRLREGVKDLKSILDDLGLPSYLKTSGGKGYHIVVPFSKKTSWDNFRKIAKNIACLLEAKYPNKYTTNMLKSKRKGKIFIDWIRNTKGATSVAPYSLRIRKKATVSMPIKWSELMNVKPDGITIDIALKRLKRKDPWEGFFKNIE